MRPVIATLVADGLLVSVDTRWAEVAAAAIAGGAHIVNDISGLADPDMMTVRRDQPGRRSSSATCRGTPATMQDHPTYDDVVAEVTASLRDGAGRALAAGVPSVLVDPGIGFGKTIEHNLALLRALPLDVAHPVVVGASRKGFIGRLTGTTAPADRDAGTLAAHLFAAQRGVALVRAHDVAAHVQALTVLAALAD